MHWPSFTGLVICVGNINSLDFVFLLIFLGGFIALMFAALPLFLPAVFCSCTWHCVPMDDWVHRQTSSAIFCVISAARSKIWGVHPNLNLWIEKMKNEKMIFCQDQVGLKGERKRDASQFIFCVCKANLYFGTSIFNFGINMFVAIPKLELWTISSTDESN